MFFELTDITAHPVDKNRGLVDPHGGQQFFQSARAVREIRKNKVPGTFSCFNLLPMNISKIDLK
jgi:hypothetical protein